MIKYLWNKLIDALFVVSDSVSAVYGLDCTPIPTLHWSFDGGQYIY